MAQTRELDDAIGAAKHGEYLKALLSFIEIFGSEDAPTIRSPKDASALSYFGLCLALVQKKYKPAIDLCKRALDLEFYNGDHYANIGRVYLAAGNRKKAYETVEAGLKLHPEHGALNEVRKELGVRGEPVVPFLTRDNPINVSLGQARHAKKVATKDRRKPR